MTRLDHYILVCSFHIFLLLLLYFITLSHYCLTNRSKAEMCKFFFLLHTHFLLIIFCVSLTSRSYKYWQVHQIIQQTSCSFNFYVLWLVYYPWLSMIIIIIMIIFCGVPYHIFYICPLVRSYLLEIFQGNHKITLNESNIQRRKN